MERRKGQGKGQGKGEMGNLAMKDKLRKIGILLTWFYCIVFSILL